MEPQGSTVGRFLGVSGQLLPFPSVHSNVPQLGDDGIFKVLKQKLGSGVKGIPYII